MEIVDACKVLGIPIEFTLSELEDAFETLSLLYHPDRYTRELRTDHEKKYNMVTEAYTILLDKLGIAVDKDVFKIEKETFNKTTPFCLKQIKTKNEQKYVLNIGVIQFLKSIDQDNCISFAVDSFTSCCCKKICMCQSSGCKCGGKGWYSYCMQCHGSGVIATENTIKLPVLELKERYQWKKEINQCIYGIIINIVNEDGFYLKFSGSQMGLEKEIIIKLKDYLDKKSVHLVLPFNHSKTYALELSKIESFPMQIVENVTGPLIDSIIINLKLSTND